MKKTLVMIAVVLAILAMLTGCGQIQPVLSETRDLLTVSDTGEVSVAPDVAYVTIGFTNHDATADAVQKANAAAMEKIVSAIKTNKIADEDIVTVRYSVNPVYDYSEQKQAVIGYDAWNAVRVKIKDLQSVGKIIDDAANAGANQIDGIEFTCEDNKEAYNKALDLAIKNAATKAKSMAESAGIRLSAPVGISESSVSSSPIYYPMNAVVRDSAMTPIQQGQIAITASVTMQYEILK